MSVTTTDNPIVTSVRKDYLEDYNIRLTGHQTPAPPSRENAPPPVSNPADWPDDFRQVPPYRPINTQLDREQRPLVGEGGVAGNIFVFHMFTGVWIQAVSSRTEGARGCETLRHGRG
jgi:hypothetical protein